jgi:hypothetical protein
LNDIAICRNRAEKVKAKQFWPIMKDFTENGRFNRIADPYWWNSQKDRGIKKNINSSRVGINPDK